MASCFLLVRLCHTRMHRTTVVGLSFEFPMPRYFVADYSYGRPKTAVMPTTDNLTFVIA